MGVLVILSHASRDYSRNLHNTAVPPMALRINGNATCDQGNTDDNRVTSPSAIVPLLHLTPVLSVSTTPDQSMQLLPQHVRHDWPMTSGSTGGFPSPAFAVSPVLDATGSDYVYLAIEDSVRPQT